MSSRFPDFIIIIPKLLYAKSIIRALAIVAVVRAAAIVAVVRAAAIVAVVGDVAIVAVCLRWLQFCGCVETPGPVSGKSFLLPKLLKILLE